MEKIKYKNIDFDRLRQLNVDSCESTVFHDKENFYKIYNVKYHAYKYKIPQKLKLFNKIDIEEAIIPQKPIYDFWNMRGFVASYKQNTKTLEDLVNDLEKYLIASIKASNILRNKLHQCELPIIVGDMHLNQVIVDEFLNIFWCDCDSYKIGNIPNNSISVLLQLYIKEVTQEKCFIASAQTDRLGMLIYFIYRLFENWNIAYLVDDIIDSKILYYYDQQAEQYNFLKKMRPVFNEIIKAKTYIPDVPYIDEIISLKDANEVSKILK